MPHLTHMRSSSLPLTSIVHYQGQLRTQAEHLRSGNTLITDAPVDNQGQGQAFSPTDLVATALASCAMTIIGIACAARKIDVDGMRAEVVKHMDGPPRRISGIDVDIHLPAKPYTTAQRNIIAQAAESCPVARSLHPELQQRLRLHWTEAE